MKTVKEVSHLSGVSIRTLHYYDKIGLLKPTIVAENGYRYYDGTALSRLQMILYFRDLSFPLETIKTLLMCILILKVKSESSIIIPSGNLMWLSLIKEVLYALFQTTPIKVFKLFSVNNT